MIDPRRKRQNAERARKLAYTFETALRGSDRGYTAAREVLKALRQGRRRNWEIPSLFDDDALARLALPKSALRVGEVLVQQALEPLRVAVEARLARNESVLAVVNGRACTLHKPTPYDSSIKTFFAPLTAHVSPELLGEIARLDMLIFDPTPNAPLAIERPDYARERTKLIEIEDALWKLSAEYGAPSDRIPYVYRIFTLIGAWLPEAHKPPGANTICLRCGELLFRKRSSFKTLPRCPACMKETPAQRAWPPHAMAPHGPGTWLLRCQYPGCEMVFEGPRHRKLCDDHVSSKMPPKGRMKAVTQAESNNSRV
jgi:hypothetical protein